MCSTFFILFFSVSPPGLPSTKLGSFLEERVNSFLRTHNVPGAEVTIRVVSSSNKLLDTRLGEDCNHTHRSHPFVIYFKFYSLLFLLLLGMVDRFSYFPNQFPYRTKALFVFEEIDGAEVCFFGMHVQEYGSDCPAPNTRYVCIHVLFLIHVHRCM